jgi:hypothetical protein
VVINLPHFHITDEDMPDVLAALAGSRCVSLDLSFNLITDAGFTSVVEPARASSCSVFHSLALLDLSNNGQLTSGLDESLTLGADGDTGEADPQPGYFNQALRVCLRSTGVSQGVIARLMRPVSVEVQAVIVAGRESTRAQVNSYCTPRCSRTWRRRGLVRLI